MVDILWRAVVTLSCVSVVGFGAVASVLGMRVCSRCGGSVSRLCGCEGGVVCDVLMWRSQTIGFCA